METLATIAPGEWDGLVHPGDLFSSYAWLRHLDDVSGAHAVVAVRASDRLVGATAVWNGERTPGLFHLRGFFTDLTGPWDEPFLWLGARRSVRNGLVCASGPLRSPALHRLLAACRDHARTHGHAGVVAPYLPLPAARELVAAHPDARLLLHSADAAIDVPPDGSAGLIARANGHGRKRRRRELRGFTAVGHTVEWSAVTSEIAAEIAPLIAKSRRKHGSAEGVSWMTAIFAAQREAGLLDDAAVAMCRRHGELAAAAVCYRHGDSLHGRYYGATEAPDPHSSPYFVTTCVAPVDYAARNGLRRVLLSTSSLQAKVLRGATLHPLAAVVLLSRGTVAGADAHNRRTVRDYRARFARFSSSLGPEWLDMPYQEDPHAASGLPLPTYRQGAQ
ncbi:GNAT family N-acetyltransferase [Nocardia wallacei]|uniref:GNAT family N-acetyltransferase n=1 Tax=Nocardia wallacei TaxID=480035 RepID=UPI0024560A66|nr:GNAT family N-acetyltransferase [Nocardia wallacei]